jgi:hypothetical protein
VAIEAWLRNHNTSPLTGLALANREVHPAPVAFRSAIQEWEKAYSKLISRASITPDQFDRTTLIGVGSFKEVCFLARVLCLKRTTVRDSARVPTGRLCITLANGSRR